LAQQTINVGSTPNDGTGDQLRSAMIKVQNNFSELYGNLFTNGFSSNVAIGNTPSSSDRLLVYSVLSNTTGSNTATGQFISIPIANSAVSTTMDVRALRILVASNSQYKNATTSNTSVIYGISSIVNNGDSSSGGDAKITTMYGIAADVYNYANGVTSNTVNTAYGASFGFTQSATAGVSNTVYTVRSIITNSGNAISIANPILYFGDYTGTTPTNSYGIYITDENKNYLSGNTGIGTATPNAKLQVSGAANISGAVVMSNTLAVTGNANFSNTLGVTGAVTFSSTGAHVGAATFSNTISVTGNANFSNTLAVTGVATITGGVVTGSQLTVRGTATAAGEGGQITLGYGNNLAGSITGQANNTFNIDVTGGNTGSTPLLRIFAVNNDGTTNGLATFANTGRINFGSTAENTDSTVKIVGTANISGNTTLSSFLYVGNTTTNTVVGYNPNNQTMAEFAGNANGYTSILVRNSNSGTQSSADFEIYNDSFSGTADKWIGMGILSSTYSNATYTIGAANDAYLYTGNSNLTIGVSNANYVSFFTNGTLIANERMRIDAGGNTGIGNTNPNAKLQVTGTANISGAVTLSTSLAVSTNTLTMGSSNVGAANFANGYARLPNGLLMQFGQLLVNTITAAQTFSVVTGVAFTNVFSMTTTTNTLASAIALTALSATSFTIVSNTTANVAVYWTAIGK
jgi:hypothetical protein